MAVGSNKRSSEDQAAHNRLLFNMTVRSVQQIRRRPEWNPENETAKATQPNQLIVVRVTPMIQDSMQLKARPQVGTLTRYPPRLLLICVSKWCETSCYSACLQLQTFYIVVFQDVVTVAQLLYLKCMHACVSRDQHLCCLLFRPREASACMCFDYVGDVHV